MLTSLAIDDGAEAEEYCDHDEDNDDGGRRAGGGGDLEAGGGVYKSRTARFGGR